jgi:hypothetical protein
LEKDCLLHALKRISQETERAIDGESDKREGDGQEKRKWRADFTPHLVLLYICTCYSTMHQCALQQVAFGTATIRTGYQQGIFLPAEALSASEIEICYMLLVY